MRFGGFWRRFLAVIIDSIIIYIPVLLIATSLGLGSAETGDDIASVTTRMKE